jgi:hypothetical protein
MQIIGIGSNFLCPPEPGNMAKNRKKGRKFVGKAAKKPKKEHPIFGPCPLTGRNFSNIFGRNTASLTSSNAWL